MKKVSDRVYLAEHLNDDCYASALPVVVEGDSSLILFDCGMDGYMRKQNKRDLEGTTVQQVVKLSAEKVKPVKHIFFSHAHGDHTLDAFIYGKMNSRICTHAHSKNRIPKGGRFAGFRITHPYPADTDLVLDGVKLKVITTPGHTVNGEDISLLVADDNVLLTGDTVQPHGIPYENGKNTFMPFYTRGDDYFNSLKKILELAPEKIVTSHHGVFGMEAVETDLKTVGRTIQLAEKLVRENPGVDKKTIIEWIFDTIGYERGVSRENVLRRRIDQETHFKRHDIHGINYFATKAMRNGKKD